MNSQSPGLASRLRVIVPLGVAVLAVVFLIVIVTSLGGSDSDDGRADRGNKPSKQRKKPKEKTYTVEPGDTLTTISDKTGVSVDKLSQLNPRIDPQALVSGDQLKLR